MWGYDRGRSWKLVEVLEVLGGSHDLGCVNRSDLVADRLD